MRVPGFVEGVLELGYFLRPPTKAQPPPSGTRPTDRVSWTATHACVFQPHTHPLQRLGLLHSVVAVAALAFKRGTLKEHGATTHTRGR